MNRIFPYIPERNGVKERDNRTIIESACSLLHMKNLLPLELWAEAVSCSVYTRNRVITLEISITPLVVRFLKVNLCFTFTKKGDANWIQRVKNMFLSDTQNLIKPKVSGIEKPKRLR